MQRPLWTTCISTTSGPWSGLLSTRIWTLIVVCWYGIKKFLSQGNPSSTKPVEIEAAFPKVYSQMPMAFANHLMHSMYRVCMAVCHIQIEHSCYLRFYASKPRFAVLVHYQSTWQQTIDRDQSLSKKWTLSKFISETIKLRHISLSHKTCDSFAVQCTVFSKVTIIANRIYICDKYHSCFRTHGLK